MPIAQRQVRRLRHRIVIDVRHVVNVSGKRYQQPLARRSSA